MRRTTCIAVNLVLVLSFFSADAQWQSRRKKRYDCGKDLTRAIARYDKGRFAETKTILSETKYQCTGHSAMDSILYFLGMAALRSKAPDEARNEFDRLVIDFPNSPFAEEAHFRIGHCSYLSSNPPERDQSNTRDAIRELSGFIDDYPQSAFADSARAYIDKSENKLAQKEFETARFYQKIQKYEAAIVYYREVTQNFAASKFTAESRLSIGYCLAKIQRTAEARQELEKLLADNPPENIAKSARNTLDRLEQIANEKPRFRLFERLRAPARDSLTVLPPPAQPDTTGASVPDSTTKSGEAATEKPAQQMPDSDQPQQEETDTGDAASEVPAVEPSDTTGTMQPGTK